LYSNDLDVIHFTSEYLKMTKADTVWNDYEELNPLSPNSDENEISLHIITLPSGWGLHVVIPIF